MRKTILLKSRYGETHRLERIGGSNSHLFLFVPSRGNYRLWLGWNKTDSYDFVDPSGGPYIRVGRELPGIGRIVKSITTNKDNKILIEFE